MTLGLIRSSLGPLKLECVMRSILQIISHEACFLHSFYTPDCKLKPPKYLALTTLNIEVDRSLRFIEQQLVVAAVELDNCSCTLAIGGAAGVQYPCGDQSARL